MYSVTINLDFLLLAKQMRYGFIGRHIRISLFTPAMQPRAGDKFSPPGKDKIYIPLSFYQSAEYGRMSGGKPS